MKANDGIHEIEEIAPQTYRIDEGGIANTYLLIGKEKALLIDSGLGVGNLKETVQGLTSLPVILALTHRHCDHAGGRNWFDKCYVNVGDKPVIYGILSSKLASKTLLKANKAEGVSLAKEPNHAKMIYIEDGYSFELGDRLVKTINVPGHTKGSIVFIDDATKLMFTGDDVNPYLWMQLPGCTSLSTWLIGAKKIEELNHVYRAYCGHDKGLIPEGNIAKLIAVVEDILKNHPTFTGKNLDYPFDKDVYPRIFVSKDHIE